MSKKLLQLLFTHATTRAKRLFNAYLKIRQANKKRNIFLFFGIDKTISLRTSALSQMSPISSTLICQYTSHFYLVE